VADEVCDDLMSMSGPPSILLCAATDNDEMFCDLSLFSYSVVHSSKALPPIGSYHCHPMYSLDIFSFIFLVIFDFYSFHTTSRLMLLYGSC